MCCACGGGDQGGSGPDEATDDTVVDDDTADGTTGECVNTNAPGNVDSYGDDCPAYDSHTNWCGNYDTDNFVSNEHCCACGGGSTSGEGETADDTADGGDVTPDGPPSPQEGFFECDVSANGEITLVEFETCY